jgi:hypothetical protein
VPGEDEDHLSSVFRLLRMFQFDSVILNQHA